MKILFIANGNYLDYQNDALLIGLKELYGGEVVDPLRHWHIYDTFPEEETHRLYGRGMTISRSVADVAVDRGNIEDKIRAGFFDLIVYGSIARNFQLIEMVGEYYPGHRVAMVDGEDDPWIRPVIGLGMQYFKRELMDWKWTTVPVWPIQFGFPTRKVNFAEPKTRDFAICDPRDTSTYIYDDEASYFRGYGEARFGVTTKKAGWDCLRHYEILGNGCIPLFLDVAECPNGTLASFPKERCLQVVREIDAGEPPAEVYDRHIDYFRTFTEEHLTTRALATRFMENIAAGAAMFGDTLDITPTVAPASGAEREAA